TQSTNCQISIFVNFAAKFNLKHLLFLRLPIQLMLYG
ncbi:hypothetical protein LINPERPRIM_LOCUS27969, partial [Linum perenne]